VSCKIERPLLAVVLRQDPPGAHDLDKKNTEQRGRGVHGSADGGPGKPAKNKGGRSFDLVAGRRNGGQSRLEKGRNAPYSRSFSRYFGAQATSNVTDL
jgi:hypothetical protein